MIRIKQAKIKVEPITIYTNNFIGDVSFESAEIEHYYITTP